METEEESALCPVHLDILTVSMALVQSASYFKNHQLYRYLYKAVHNQVTPCLI
jgi:enolase